MTTITHARHSHTHRHQPTAQWTHMDGQYHPSGVAARIVAGATHHREEVDNILDLFLAQTWELPTLGAVVTFDGCYATATVRGRAVWRGEDYNLERAVRSVLPLHLRLSPGLARKIVRALRSVPATCSESGAASH